MTCEIAYDEKIDSLMSFFSACRSDWKQSELILKAMHYNVAYTAANEFPTLKEALGTPDHPAPNRDNWIQAVHEEIGSWRELGVYKEIPKSDLPAGRKPINTKIVLRLKLDKLGNPSRYKARIVQAGWQAVQGEDYLNPHSPIASSGSIRMLIALGSRPGYVLGSSDVKTAYLNAGTQKKQYLKPDKTLLELCPDIDRDSFWETCRSIYGQADAGRNWWLQITSDFKEFGLLPCSHDECLYIYTEGEGENKQELIVALAVDDILHAGSSQEIVDKFLSFLKDTKGYTIDTDKELDWYLAVAYEMLDFHSHLFTRDYDRHGGGADWGQAGRRRQ